MPKKKERYLYLEVIHCPLNLSVQATRMKIPILIDVERIREGIDDLLPLASYAVCSAKFPQASNLFSDKT